MSDWLFDLGNSRFKFAPLAGEVAGSLQAWPHGAEPMTAAALEALPCGDTAWVASVAAPALTTTVMALLHERFACVEVARTLHECAGVTVAYARPEKFGVDRFLALLAAAPLRQPALVVGVGTGLTIDLLDAAGRHRGGRIAASPTTMREALHARAVQLPASGGDYTEFAADTADALASGCDGAAIGLVERSMDAARALLGEAPALRLHGGGATVLRDLLPAHGFEPDLVLRGLARWHALRIA